MSQTKSKRPQAKMGDCNSTPQRVPPEQEITQLINQGAHHLERGQASMALPYLQQAWALDSNRVAAAINLAGAYILLGRHKEALPVLEHAASLEAHNAMIWVNLGAAHLGNPVLSSPEQQERAIQAFERALELQPDLPNIHYNLGLIYRDQKQWGKARQEFERALIFNPADRDAQMLLNEVLDILAKSEAS